MDKLIAVFSGQGSQSPSMGKDLYDNFSAAKKVYQCGEDILGMPIKRLSFEGTAEEISTTLISQPLIFACSMAAALSAKDFMPSSAASAGHSLGEFAALCFSGAFSLEDGFRIIKARATAMNNASENVSGAMSAILGSSIEAITAACNRVGGFVFPVNLNLPSQTVISGISEDINKVVALLTSENKKVKERKLAVSSAFHTTMMSDAAIEFKNAVDSIKFNPTEIPFFSNVTGGMLEIANYPEYFAQHMTSPVQFVDQVSAIVSFGITKAVEFGPNKTVSTLIKKNNKAIATMAVNNCNDITMLKEF